MIFTTLLSVDSPHQWAYIKDPKDPLDASIYRDFHALLLRSIYAHKHPTDKVIVRGINFTTFDRQQHMPYSNNGNDLILSDIQQDFRHESPAWYKGYLMHQRTKFILRVLDVYREPVIYLDTDCLLRSSLDPLINLLDDNTQGYDFTILHRPGQFSDAYKVNCGVMLFLPKPRTFDLLEMWLSYMDGLGDYALIKPQRNDGSGRGYAKSQELFYTAYQLSKAVMYQLPPDYNDGRLFDSSTIWHGHKGSSKARVLKKFKADMELRDRRL